jgi:hypothetical protein
MTYRIVDFCNFGSATKNSAYLCVCVCARVCVCGVCGVWCVCGVCVVCVVCVCGVCVCAFRYKHQLFPQRAMIVNQPDFALGLEQRVYIFCVYLLITYLLITYSIQHSPT